LFKNAEFFKIDGVGNVVAQLPGRVELSANKFTPCEPQQESSHGWAVPCGDDLLFEGSGCYAISMMIEDKIIPAATVRDAVSIKLEALEEKLGRKPRKDEKSAAKEEVLFDLRPKAFSRHSKVDGYIDYGRSLLIVDSASAAKVDMFTGLLRKTVGGSLPIKRVDSSLASILMTNMVDGRIEEEPPFDFSDYVKTASPTKVASTAVFRGGSPMNDDVQAAIKEEGREVVELGFIFGDKVEFKLDRELKLKGIKYLDLIQDQVDALEPGTKTQAWVADFAIMSSVIGEIYDVIDDVFTASNGDNENEEEDCDAE